MYAYTSLVKDLDSFKSVAQMKFEMSDVWKRRNMREKSSVGFIFKEIPKSSLKRVIINIYFNVFYF
jgi:hypothetical protein